MGVAVVKQTAQPHRQNSDQQDVEKHPHRINLDNLARCVNSGVGERPVGVLVSTDTGVSTHYAIQHLEERGIMFIEPGTPVYEGMIIGENKYPIDLAVNPINEKNLTNQRSSSKDSTVVLKTPRKMSLEACLDYINSDELVEVTPTTYRMRKKILNTSERKKADAKVRMAKEQ